LVTGRKLLLADDSVTIQKVVDLTFADEGIEVVAVSDGEQALSKLDTFLPDVVLADVFMPKVNGYEVCDYVKRHERLRHIPVMLLVGSFEPFDEAEARRVGADDYLTKPFQSIRQLVQKVGALLGKNPSDEAATAELPAPTPTPAPEQSVPASIELRTADTQPLPAAPFDKSFPGAANRNEQSFADLAFEEEAPAAAKQTAITEERTQPAVMSTFDSKEQGRSFAPETVEASAAPFASRQARTSSSFSHAAAADDALLDLGDITPSAQTVEADDFILDLREDAGTAGVSVFPEHSIAKDIEDEYEQTGGVSLGDANEPRHSTEVMPEPRITEFASPSAGPGESPVSTTPAEKPTTTGGAQMGAGELSPEAIDAIARRVVELMSTKVIEEIAWEVVPHLSEMLIKQQLENQSKTR
jgi:CheY-like chemotaxis protein